MPKRGRRDDGSHFEGSSGEAVGGEDLNRRMLEQGRELMMLPSIDLEDADAIDERFQEYVRLCSKYGLKPLMNGLSMALGLSRTDFAKIGQGYVPSYIQLTSESLHSLKRCFDFMQNFWEGALSEDKGNPVKWFFLGKNHFGYRDQKEQIIAKVDPLMGLKSAQDIASKYGLEVVEPQKLGAGSETETLGDYETQEEMSD